MFIHHLIISIRALRRNPLSGAINISGLAIGIACCLLIFGYLDQEWNYDRSHKKADRIFRLNIGNLTNDGRSAITAGAMAPDLAPDFPEIEQFTRFRHFPSLVAKGEERFYEDRFFYTDSTVFEVFDFPLAAGNPKQALAQPFSIVLTREGAEKYFPGENPLGQTLRIDNREEFQVTGVLGELPAAAHFHFDFLASVSSLRTHPDLSVRYYQLTSWFSHYYYTFLLLKPDTDLRKFEEKIKHSAKTYAPPDDFERYGTQMGLYLQPLTDIHLNPVYGELAPQGSRSNLRIMGLAAIFILLIACVNYANLSAALGLTRAKEMGMRQLMGSGKSRLIRQLMGEAFILSFLAMLLGYGLAWVFRGPLGQITGQQLNFGPSMIGAAAGLFLFSGIVGGIYPTWMGIRFSPIRMVKSGVDKPGKLPLAKILVVFQFAVSIILIIATLVVFRQLKFMQESPLGLNVDQVLVLPIHGNEGVIRQLPAFQSAIKANPGVVSTTVSELVPGQPIFGFVSKVEGMESALNFQSIPMGYDFLETFQLELVAGRDFSRDISTDTLERAIVNESFVRYAGWKTPEEALGKSFDMGNDGVNTGHIIGVVKDAHFRSLKFDISPLVFFLDDGFYHHISIRLSGDNMSASLAYIEKTWEGLFPQAPFNYFFADENFNLQHAAELRTGKLFALFGGLSIFLACCGLFGLSFFTVRRRGKEISIRKVLGATVLGIVQLISKDFMKLVLSSIFIATPLAWYFMSGWLENFAYRAAMGTGVFWLAGVLSAVIAFLTLSIQALKTAIANPADLLKEE